MKYLTKVTRKKRQGNFSCLLALLFLALLSINSNAQFTTEQCLYDFDAASHYPQNFQGIYESEHGYVLPVHGTLRVLVVYAEIEYDTGTDPNPNNTAGWNVNELPNWADDLFDPQLPTGPAQGEITRYFQEASFNDYMLLGDYLLEPNNGIFTVLKSDINAVNGNYNLALCNTINQQMNGNFVTGNGLNSVTYFDNWTKTDLGKPKITPSIDNPYKYDHVMFIWRNRTGYNGTGNTAGSGFSGNILGYNGDSHSNIGSYNSIPTRVARHEYSHNIFGGNNFHCSGGGWGPNNYWIPITGGWSSLGLSYSSLQCANAWERQRLDWKVSGNNYNPGVRNANNTTEVNGDLDATNPNDAGIYTLRDFVTTGDAIRIKLPFTDPVNEFPEYLWLENHRGTTNNDSPFDQWQYQGASCVDPFTPGLMVYLQIDKEIRSSENKWELFGAYADYLRPLTADGFFDRDFETTTVFNDCVQWGDTYAFTEGLPNPLTGGCDQEAYSIDVNNDGLIEKHDQRANFVEIDQGTYHKHLYALGHSSHVFTLNGNNKVGIATNPSSASMMNLVSYNSPIYSEKNLRKVYLNGISVEIISCNTNGEIQVEIKFDDVDVDNDVRWCADEIVLSPVTTTSGFSLNLKSGNKILLDQGITATRMRNPVTFSGKQIFVSPTLLRCSPNTVFNMESSSTLELDNASTLRMEPNSTLDVGTEATVELKNESNLIVQNNATLTFKSGSQLYLSDGSELVVEPGGLLIIESGVNIYGQLSDKIIVNGDIQVGDNVHFNRLGNSGYFAGLDIINQNTTTILNQVTFTKTRMHNYGNSLIVNDCNFDDCFIIISHRGTVTYTNSDFDRTWLYIENINENNYAATVADCNFTTDITMAAIDLWNYDNYRIENNTINGYYNGIQLWQSGDGNIANYHHIHNNEIFNCNVSGISIYDSKASVSQNFIHDNNIGNPSDPLLYFAYTIEDRINQKDIRYNCWTDNDSFVASEDLYPHAYFFYSPTR